MNRPTASFQNTLRTILVATGLSTIVACQPGDELPPVIGTQPAPSQTLSLDQAVATRTVAVIDTQNSELVQQQAEPPRKPVDLPQGEHDWPRLLGEDFSGTGVCEDIMFDWSQRPSVAWTLDVGEGYGLGSVKGEHYFQFDTTWQNGQPHERLRSIKLLDGSEVWSVSRPMQYRDMYGYESGPRGTPTIAGDRIITLGVAGDLCCRNIDDGKLIWSLDTNSKYGVVQNFFGVGSSPLILGDKVIVSIGGSPPEDQSIAPGRLDRVIPNGTAVVAFDLMDGKELWRSGDDLASYSSPRSMKLGSTTAILQFARDHLLAIDAETGKPLWRFHHRAEILESVNAMIPIVREDEIFISECYQIGSVLLKASTDGVNIVWQDDTNNRRNQVMRCHWSTPILVDGHLYGCSGRNNPDSDFRCVEWETGKLKWNDGRRIRSSVAKANDHLIVWEERGSMQIIQPNPNKLDVVAQYDFQDLVSYPCWAAPIVVGNRILVRGDEKIVCLTPKSDQKP